MPLSPSQITAAYADFLKEAAALVEVAAAPADPAGDVYLASEETSPFFQVADRSYRIVALHQIPGTLQPYQASFLNPDAHLLRNTDPVSIVVVSGEQSGSLKAYTTNWREYNGLLPGLRLSDQKVAEWPELTLTELPETLQARLALY